MERGFIRECGSLLFVCIVLTLISFSFIKRELANLDSNSEPMTTYSVRPTFGHGLHSMGETDPLPSLSGEWLMEKELGEELLEYALKNIEKSRQVKREDEQQKEPFRTVSFSKDDVTSDVLAGENVFHNPAISQAVDYQEKSADAEKLPSGVSAKAAPVDFFDVPYTQKKEERVTLAKEVDSVEKLSSHGVAWSNPDLSPSKQDVKTVSSKKTNALPVKKVGKVVTVSTPKAVSVVRSKDETPVENKEQKEIAQLSDDLVSISVEPKNEFWMVSSECIASCSKSPEALKYWSYRDGNWTVSSFEQFRTNPAGCSTVFYIHGNLTDSETAISDGNYLWSRLKQIQKTNHIDRPFRLVVWKWFSTKTNVRIRKDFQYKAAIAEGDGRCLAALLMKGSESQTNTIVGFSFGARTIGCALETIKQREASLTETNAILIAAATDYGAFESTGAYAQGTKLLNSLWNVYNPTDRALRFYPLLYGKGGPSAVGVAPLSTGSPEVQTKVRSVNSSGYGPKHSFMNGINAISDSDLSDIVFGSEEN